MLQLEKQVAIKCLVYIARPVVAFCLKHGVKLQELVDVLKRGFVKGAEKALLDQQEKRNSSRISAMTGVHRKDVSAIFEDDRPAAPTLGDPITRILGKWQSERRFTSAIGQPRVLSYETPRSEFHALVNSVSSDLNAGTILFELGRVGAIEKTVRGLKLLATSYVPTGDVDGGFAILADDQCDLIDVVSANILEERSPPQLHARTSYDNIRPDSVRELELWLLKEGHRFHKKVRDKLSAYDQDINPDAKFKGNGVRISFTSFAWAPDLRRLKR